MKTATGRYAPISILAVCLAAAAPAVGQEPVASRADSQPPADSVLQSTQAPAPSPPAAAPQPAPVADEVPLGETSVSARPFPAQPLASAEVVLTPTRTESLRRQFGGSVSVITGQRIGQTQQPFIRDVLLTTPGLDIVQSGGPGRAASLFLRGGNSRQTKVLLDGIPINDPSNPQRAFDFGPLMAVEIERIEVLRGPQSTLWGSDAVGGVVNIITRRGEGPARLALTAMGGSFGTVQQTASLSGSTDALHYSIGASWFDQDGFSAAASRFGRNNPESDLYRSLTQAGRVGWTPSETFDVDVVWRYLETGIEVDGFGFDGFATDNPLATSDGEQFYGRTQARLALLDGLVEQRVAFNYTNINRAFEDPSPPFPFSGFFHGKTRKFEYQTNVQLLESNRFTAGIDYQDEQFDDPASFPRNAIWNRAFYVQDQAELWDRWFTTAGMRWDQYELAGSTRTWRVASIFHVPETGSALHGSYGTGFVAPALFELFAGSIPFIGFTGGNPTLRPESSRGFEYGMQQAILQERVLVDVTFFRNDFRDLIQFGIPTYMNVSRARTSGLEVTSTLQLTESTRLEATYTHTAPRDQALNRDLILRPRHKGSLVLDQRILDGRGNWYVQLLAVGDRFDYFAPVAFQELHPYAVVNTAVAFDVTERVRLFGRIDNLFDTDYEEAFSFTTAPFSVYGGVQIAFGGR